jgi:hypothetical protein
MFDGMWWKDRRLKPGEDGPATEKEKLLYEKPYDHYFCEPDDLWEQKYPLPQPHVVCACAGNVTVLRARRLVQVSGGDRRTSCRTPSGDGGDQAETKGNQEALRRGSFLFAHPPTLIARVVCH